MTTRTFSKSTSAAPSSAAREATMYKLTTCLCLSALLVIACGPDESEPDAGTPDAGRIDAGTDGGTDAGETGAIECGNTLATPPTGSACAVTAGDANLLLEGNVLTPAGELLNGQLLVGGDGKILCAACQCGDRAEAAGATRVSCPNAAVAPGFINAHDHITYTGLSPAPHTERYEQRHDWRKAKRGHTKISSPSTAGAVAWGEMRQAIAGTTSLIGSGGAAGFLRNLDESTALQEGLAKRPVLNDTFPLNDTDGQQLATGCAYPALTGTAPALIKEIAGSIEQAAAYVPHVSEGIDAVARNEFLCLSSTDDGGQNVALSKSVFIHGIGLKPRDYALMAEAGTGLIWSPRSNVDLYGMTAEVTTASRLGVQIALGTDWTASGSMSMLRELRCADYLNRNHYDRFFSDRQLFAMATSEAASVAAVDDVIGSLKTGYFADVSVFAAAGRSSGWRAAIDAEAKDVLLVLRAGKPLFGEAAVVDALSPTGCEVIEVCTTSRKVCAERETGKTMAALKSAAGSPYGLFFCGDPENEPSCVPLRPGEFTGQSSTEDPDGDGVVGAADNCPSVFNPPRPVDGNAQGNADADGEGDACDVCPNNANTPTCTPPPRDDADLDGVKDSDDNCQYVANADQKNTDGDTNGDACDACPAIANPAGDPCPTTIYAIKQSTQSALVLVPDALVTAVGATGYFVAHVPGDAVYDNELGADFSGLFIYAGSAVKPPVGARVSLKGTSSDYYGQRQFGSAAFTLKSEGNPLPAPVLVSAADIATDGARAARLESVLVRVENLVVTSVEPVPDESEDPPLSEFVVTGGLRVNDFLHLAAPFPAVGETLLGITGVLRRASNNSKLEPRSEADITRKLTLARLTPADAFLPIAVLDVPVSLFEVQLSAITPIDVVVELTSSDPAVTVPATVTVPANAKTVAVEVTPKALAAAPVTITAKFDGFERTATVTTYDPAGPRVLTAFTVAPAVLHPTESATLKATIDLPAGAGGVTIPLSGGGEFVSLAAGEIVIAEGSREGAVLATYVAPGDTEITADYGDVSLAVSIETIAAQPARKPLAGDLLITETMPNPAMAAADELNEWFELFNNADASLELDGLVLSDNAGSHTVASAGLLLAPGAYAVFAFNGDFATNGGVTAAYAYGASGYKIVLGNGGDSLKVVSAGVTIDEKVWTASTAGKSICRKMPYSGNTWGVGAATYSTTDSGTPGAENTAAGCQ